MNKEASKPTNSQKVVEDSKSSKPIRDRSGEPRALRLPDPNVDTLFKARIADQLTSLRALAGRMGMEPSSLSMTINGKRKLTGAEAGQLAELLEVPVAEVLRHAGIEIRHNGDGLAPVVAWLDAQGLVHREGLLGPKAVTAPAGTGEGLQAIRAQAGRLDGWTFFFRDVAQGVGPEAVGRLCVVRVAGEEGRRLRFVSRGYEQGVWTLGAMDGDIMEAARLVSAAPIVWAKQ